MPDMSNAIDKVPIGLLRSLLEGLKSPLDILGKMDTANLTAAWLSFLATAVGLGGLISQASAINEKLDPFHASRTAEYLGVWFQRQAAFPWWRIAKPPPQGPVIRADMARGFCGVNVIHVTRIPLLPPGRAGWSLILAMLNAEDPAALLRLRGPAAASGDGDGGAAEKGGVSSASAESVDGAAYRDSWAQLERKALKRHQEAACIVISRTTLITMLVLTNGRPVFQYSDASGFRAGYASYCGQWYITWPIGQEAIVKFAAHDSIGHTEVLPRSFAQRADRCAQILSGVVSSPPSGFSVAFGGRRPAGTYRLEHAAKGFQGAHSGRHLYNMLGGRAFEVDFLLARPIDPLPAEDSLLVLELPAADQDDNKHRRRTGSSGEGEVRMVVGPREEEILRRALDCLPWTRMSWSAHRGLRDVLLAYGRPAMEARRERLAELLRRTVERHADEFRARGWDAAFVRENMAHMAVSAVLAGGGNSGDSVRVVTDVAAVAVAAASEGGGEWGLERLDEVRFWRDLPEDRGREPDDGELDAQAVVALTKMFVLEWSQEFDYQLYHHLPIELYFG
ncbi:hypothetical protein AAE478_007150 [Parahypoxylon ruwenzoriense]